MSELSKLTGFDWLVAARNEIQSLMLELHNRLPKSEPSKVLAAEPQVDWHLFIGAAFSLWRAVFLVDRDGVERKMSDLTKDAAEFLERVIETNAITFGDELKWKTWSSGYYVNNARYRVKSIIADPGLTTSWEVETDAILKDVWNETFVALRKALESAGS